MSLHTLHHHGPCKPSSCATFALNSHGGRAATGQNNIYWVYAHRVTSVVSNSLRPCRLWPARLLCQGGGFSKQEYWRPLANTSCHTLQEHYISCCPSCQFPLSTLCCQNPCNPSSCTTSTPGPHRGKSKPSRAASGANSSGQPTCRGGSKTTIETQGQCG